jgi:hypothetical protein
MVSGETYVRWNWQGKLLNQVDRIRTAVLKQCIQKAIDRLLDVRAHGLNVLLDEKGLHHTSVKCQYANSTSVA